MLKDIFKKHILFYKLLINILIALLVIWFFVILGEAFLPGFISTNISFLKLILLIFSVILSVYLISTKIEKPTLHKSELSKPTLFITIFFLIIISGLALLKFSYFSNVVITLTTLLILFYFYKEMFNHEN
ncbi:MAG: hypothetical protein UR60_C0001G0029 [Candidatus Moranbacteria bacterium GW2011_GWF2_34_56]|nr:MAG: hypothetical protein UR51_C0002G0024 [Candidatus Moranbacteria bacterium GW2011_GWF1_34_10]KKP65422.1 MAG: hypothetical protein UR60_C0001G0029 [Candidatus Moranbacteria bacterium GW2011_GWF2_34_56]